MYQIKKHLQRQRIIAWILILLMLLACCPAESFAAADWRPGTKVYFRQGAVLKGSDSSGKGNHYFYNSSSKYTNRWPNSSGTKWLREDCYALTSPLHAYTVAPLGGGRAKPAYCLEQNVQNPSSGNTKYTADKWQNSPFVGDLYDEKVQRGILLALLYGRQPDSKTSDIEELFGISGANLDDWYMATQALIWEYQQGLRTSAAGGRKSYGITKPDFFFGTVRGRKAGDIYNGMLKQMKNHENVPSFTKKENRRLQPIQMTFDENTKTWKSKVLTDRQKSGQDLKVMASLNLENTQNHENIKIIQQEKSNQYIIETGLDPEHWDGKTFLGRKHVPQIHRNDLLTWNAHDGSHYQTLATGADDPVHFYFKLFREDIPEEKEQTEPEVPSFSFNVEKMDKNPGFDQSSGTSHTGMGDAALDSEITLFIDGQPEDARQLSVHGDSDSPFFFLPWSDISELEKETVPHLDEDGNLLYTEYIYTGEKTVYTQETALPDGRFSEKDSGTGNGIRDHGTIRYWARCTDEPAGPEYKITYIGEDGTETVVTDPTLISPEEPLLMENDMGERAYVNDHYRGELQIIKTKNDQDPFTDQENSDNGIKDYSTKSKWTVQLKSGGWESCPYIRVVPVEKGQPGYDKFANTYRVVRDSSGIPADSSHPLSVSEKGQIKILDLPYGTYIVSEIAADADGYVLESFEITVSQDGQLISREINNKAKTNRIKVVKTNLETGKTVRWDAERTAFRIKYLGNPDLEKPESAANAGRYLPNGSSYRDENQNYIFYADTNGEILLPYEIEYGNYLIEELIVPKGYYVGAYDDKGKGTIADMGKVDIIDHTGKPAVPPKTFLETVQVRDQEHNRVETFQGDSETVYNTYGFSVLEQSPHINGENYTLYFAVVEMPNNPVKGKLEIRKDGQALAGWRQLKENGYTFWEAIWGKSPLKGSRFEVYAAEDILQSDGVVPVKAFTTSDQEPVELKKVSRDHSDTDGAKEVWEKKLAEDILLRRTFAKDIGKNNVTVTDYHIRASKGASYEESFSVRDEEAGTTRFYQVQYQLNYAKGGFNYTDVYMEKKTVSDDYTDQIQVTEPVLKSGDLEVGFVTMNYDGGNRVRMNRLKEETGDDFTGVYGSYCTEDITAVKVLPDLENPQQVPEILPPEGWELVRDEQGNLQGEGYLITKEGKYRILIREGEDQRWIPCTKDGDFYKSYLQRYAFTTAQHDESSDGFSLRWDEIISMDAAADSGAEQAVTVIKGFPETEPSITESSVYSHITEGEVTTFTGKPTETAPVYFQNQDGIRTEMILSGGLTHTKITLLQSQLKKFAETLPMVQWFDGDSWTGIEWNADLKPGNHQFQWIHDDRNYIKARRWEAGPNHPEVSYTIEIVSDNAVENAGFRIIYPDTTQAAPLIEKDGNEGRLQFFSADDTMVYPIGKAVEVITTNGSGIAESSPLSLGSYWVREIFSGEGHVSAGQWRKMTVSYQDQYTPVIWDTEEFENQVVSVRIDLEKLFETDYKSGTYLPGSGAVFGIYTAEEIKASVKGAENPKTEKEILPSDTLVGYMAVSDGHASAAVKLPLGKYYIKEISTPQGYKTNHTKYYFDAVDILTADQMSFHYRKSGVSGFLTQDGSNGVILDFDTLYRYADEKIFVNHKAYKMNENAEEKNIRISVLDGRTNTQIRVEDGTEMAVQWESGSIMKISAKGQGYTVVLEGMKPTALKTGPDGNENFTVKEQESSTEISYSPKVTKTNWLSEMVCGYQKPDPKPKPETEQGEDMKTAEQSYRTLEFTSPEGTSKVQAKLDADYKNAVLSCLSGTITGIRCNGENVKDLTKSLQITREDRAEIYFADGVSFHAEFDQVGNFYMNASGASDKNLDAESVLTADGSEILPDFITLKHTKAKTYARNNTSAAALHITIQNVKNDRLPEEPEEPPVPEKPEEPDNPEEPEKPELPDEPEEPERPEIPEKPEVPEKDQPKTPLERDIRIPKTGDTKDLTMYLILALAAAGGLIISRRRYK